MPSVNISVNGQLLGIPGVYPYFLLQPTVPSGFIPTGPLLFLAQGNGGVPFTPYNFTDPTSLQNAMRGATSQDYVDFLFNPSTQVNGSSLVTYINVAPNTRSSASMVNSGSVTVVDLLSVDYGAPSNLLQFTVASGTISGSKKVTLLDGFSGVQQSQDNLGIPFQLAYTNSSSPGTVTYSVVSTNNIATSFVINSTNVGESVTLDLTTSTYSTINAIIQYLNGTGFYFAYGVSNGQQPSANLDAATGISLPAPIANVNQYVSVTATLGDIVYWVNHGNPQIVSASISAGIISAPAEAPSNTALQFLGGGTNAVASLSNYASGLNVALNQPAWAVFVDSSAAGVRALAAQHVATASSIVQRKWRRYVTGSVLNETAATAMDNARGLNQNNVTYCWPGVQRTSLITGLNTTYDGMHVAAAVAGIMCGNAVAMPITNKTIIGNGVETQTDLATKIALQNAGVLVLDFPTQTRIPTFLSDVTTWQNDSNFANVFNQQIACQYAMGYYLRNALQPFIGNIASSYDLGVLQRVVQKTLNSLIYNGQGSEGILNSWDPTTLVVSYNGSTQTVYISVSAIFVGQNRFIVFTTTVTPLNITVLPTGVITTA